MMIMETSSRRPPLEPVLPLINVVFLLLIFFMLAGQLAKSPTVSVDTPLSQSANGPEARDKLLLVLQKDGQWFAEDNDTRLVARHGFLVEQAEDQDGQPVARLAKVRCGTVEDDVAGAAFAGDCVGLEPVAVGQVAADNALVRKQTHLVHQVMVDGEAALVLDVAISHQCPVYFSLEQMNLHLSLTWHASRRSF